ncbi:P-loop containing nucleoside triphosphate hydrolase protein [Lasiosphaeria hispida]|uniref:small monomeric GTPase n=1 Tax=Lasiosphaeria hispida TaxID=260671 RepID=A0AAJ0HRG3_9PEZI|nr:P-loop containing nucleoside triphosphate hydrolase protein [Lasiosphaeria hispida]
MVNSFVWTADEAKYLKAVLRWQDTPEDEKTRAAAAAAAATEAAERRRRQPAGEFRILVIGARGSGKTSILTRFGNGTFRGEGEPPDPFYERGCRHPVDIEGVAYVVDALEMPSKHLLSNPMLEQALNITEAAVLVYDVRDPASLRLAEGLAEFMRDNIGNAAGGKPPRDYALMLVGNKSDVDDEERAVSWAAGSKAATAIKVPGRLGSGLLPSPAAGAGAGPAGLLTPAAVGCAFLEVSAKTGDNIDKVFPQMGREILRIKKLNEQRREQAERLARQAAAAQQAAQEPMKKKLGLWRMISTPFFRRQTAY